MSDSDRPSIPSSRIGRPSVLRHSGGAGIINAGWLTPTTAPVRSQHTKLTEAAAFDSFHITEIAIDGKNRIFVNEHRFPWAVSNQGYGPGDADDVNASVFEVKRRERMSHIQTRNGISTAMTR